MTDRIGEATAKFVELQAISEIPVEDCRKKLKIFQLGTWPKKLFEQRAKIVSIKRQILNKDRCS